MARAEDMASEIEKLLSEFGGEVQKAMEEEIDSLSKEIFNGLSASSAIPERSGEYKKGFRIKKTRGSGRKTAVIYNKKYQITHLLEEGHGEPKDGSKRAYRTRRFPHWKAAQKKAETLPERVRRRLEQ